MVGIFRSFRNSTKMRISNQVRLRQKCTIVGTIANIRTKKNFSHLHGRKLDFILVWRCTDKTWKGSSSFPVKRFKE